METTPFPDAWLKRLAESYGGRGGGDKDLRSQSPVKVRTYLAHPRRSRSLGGPAPQVRRIQVVRRSPPLRAPAAPRQQAEGARLPLARPGLQPALGLGNLAPSRSSHPPSAWLRAAGPAAGRKPAAAGAPRAPAARRACGRPGQLRSFAAARSGDARAQRTTRLPEGWGWGWGSKTRS